MRILVTGAAGFIGSNYVRYMLSKQPDAHVVALDKLTYAGNLANLAAFEGNPRFQFVQADICDPDAVGEALAGCDALVNFAAESHVDRSVIDPMAFVKTNVEGIRVLMEAARTHSVQRIVQVSTDEVYGHVPDGSVNEQTLLAPRNPYSASKAGGELLALSYFTSFGLPVMVTRGVNTIGPSQYPEKVVPVFVTNAIDDEQLPIYGEGKAVREYMYVTDHCTGIDLVLHRGEPGAVYNVGVEYEVDTVTLATSILELLEKPRSLMRLIEDRPGHDYRYSLDSARLEALGWQPKYTFPQALAETVNWYVENEDWWRAIKSGSFGEYYARNYAERLARSRPVAAG
ncbi:MAG: dTDP-glucose 4,6-dehydratase [Chloroflexota bacterium]|nr:dTDP-glucose 4,6-dehydratase [Chloroflexota bacterium]MDE2841238.1 dTDP-glucose 4,6-dehydratase [Chloroflexota bacterium]MDE2930424.1 dTDP-glucose 4,6-dehydratase [Chloroflexota bacterium]